MKEEKMFLTEATENTELEGKNTGTLPENICAYANIFRQHCLSLSVNSVRSVRVASGFSLIEVLVAMTVLIILVVMVTNMFRNTSEAWDIGTQRAEMNTAARAALEYISRELSCAMAGTIQDSQGTTLTLKPFKLLAADSDLSFSALSGGTNSIHGLLFRFDSVHHIIETAHNNDSPYGDTAWDWQTAALLITNVWRFTVAVSSNKDDMMIGGVGYAYDSSASANGYQLPVCVDISIEMLGEKNMARALSLTPGPQQDGFVMTNSRVYTTRVCFPNRGGR